MIKCKFLFFFNVLVYRKKSQLPNTIWISISRTSMSWIPWICEFQKDWEKVPTMVSINMYFNLINFEFFFKFAVRLSSRHWNLLYISIANAPSWSLPCNLLTELPQGAPQGLPSSFAWTDKYRHSQSGCLFAANPHHQDNPFLHDTFNPGSTDNPFQEDVFDPLKYMNISDGQKRVVATDNVPSLYLYSVSSVLVLASKSQLESVKLKVD